MTRADIPNIISVLRIGLVFPVVAALVHEQYLLALLLYLIAGLSDALDGYIAKRYDYASRLGSILDPIADKLLLVSTFLALAWLGLLPWWLVAVVIGRDLLILAGALAYHLLIGRYEMVPTLISKLNTFCQLLLGLLVVLSRDLLPVPEWGIAALVYIVFATTLVSGADYVWTWSIRARDAGLRTKD